MFRAITLWLVIACVLGAQALQGKPGEVFINIGLQIQPRSEEDYDLHIVLTNTGREQILVQKASLPWGERHRLLLFAALPTSRSTTVLDAVLVIAPPEDQEVSIRPGQKLQGTISLTKRFPELSKALRKFDVIVFWTYQLEASSGATSDRFAGWLVVPRSGAKVE